MSQTLTRTGLIIPSSDRSDGFHPNADIRALGLWLEDNAALTSQGVIGAIPSPGKRGRFYKPTTAGYENTLYYDNGTVWVQIGTPSPPTDPAANIGGLRTLGGGGAQAAPGNHGHGAEAITSGTLDAARLPAGVAETWSRITSDVSIPDTNEVNSGLTITLSAGVYSLTGLLWIAGDSGSSNLNVRVRANTTAGITRGYWGTDTSFNNGATDVSAYAIDSGGSLCRPEFAAGGRLRMGVDIWAEVNSTTILRIAGARNGADGVIKFLAGCSLRSKKIA